MVFLDGFISYRATVHLQIVVSLVPRKVKQLLKLYFKNRPHLPPFTNPILLFSCFIHKPSVLCCISDHLLYHFSVVMVKDLQIVQVLACDLILRVGNLCVFFSLHAAMFLGMDCLGF